MHDISFFPPDFTKSEFGKHKSNAEQLINAVPVIEVDGVVAVRKFLILMFTTILV